MSFKKLLSAGIMAVTALTGCNLFDSGTGPGEDTTTAYDFTEILEDYVDGVVVATYRDMSENAASLLDKVIDLNENPGNQDLVEDACALWKKIRAPWELSEAFLFGPASFLALDPALDSWPLDRQQLNSILASDLPLNQDGVELLGPVVRGFHTVEYLLFRDGEPRDADSITSREMDYLVATAGILADDTETLRAAWATGEYEGGTGRSYASEFKNAGNAGSRYLNQSDAVIEIVEGIIAICEEVGTGKLADPYNEDDVTLVESQFSWNSLNDFQNNIRSVKNAYTGDYGDVKGTGLDGFVNSRNAALDDEVKNLIEETIEAIADIPEPFRENITSSNVKKAMDKCVELQKLFDEKVKPLIN